jgi:ribosomal protein S18 acetylase RimI-like enzyme
MGTVSVRRAVRQDLPALGRLGARLARMHHGWDRKRFFVVPKMHEGYAWWLGKELGNTKAIVLAAESKGRIVGYAYGTIEPRDWNALRDTCGVLVDLIVEPRARRTGAGRMLCDAMFAAFAAKGMPRVILQTAAGNEAGRAFFASLGFRPTVVEMALELRGRA